MKRFGLIALIVVIIVVVAGGIYFNKLTSKIVVESKSEPASVINTTPTPTPDPMAPRNVLLLGYGGPDHDGGYLTDTMILAHVVPKSSKVILITIPRDLWIKLKYNANEPEGFKINHAYSVGVDNRKFPDKYEEYQGVAGGGNLAKKAVEIVTGLRVDNFVSVNFQGFTNIVDTLGGIEVIVPYTFDDEYYPIKGEEDNPCDKTEEQIELLTATMSGTLLEKQFPCRYEKLHFEAGLNRLDSQTALKFVRSRHSQVGGGDFGRSTRQLAFIEGVKDELLSFNSLVSAIPVLNQLSDNVRTDIDVKSALRLLRNQGKISDVEISAITINDSNVLRNARSRDGQYILMPVGGEDNWDKVHEYVNKEIERALESSEVNPKDN